MVVMILWHAFICGIVKIAPEKSLNRFKRISNFDIVKIIKSLTFNYIKVGKNI